MNRGTPFVLALSLGCGARTDLGTKAAKSSGACSGIVLFAAPPPVRGAAMAALI